jgi:ketosteroid isomerase-like protein
MTSAGTTSTQVPTAAELARRAHKAYQAQDIATLSDCLAPDIVWSFPGRSLVSGTFHDQPDLFAMFETIGRLTGGTYWAEGLDYYGSDEWATIVLRVTAKREGKADLDVLETLLFRAEGGKLVRCWHIPLDEAAWDEFFS